MSNIMKRAIKPIKTERRPLPIIVRNKIAELIKNRTIPPGSKLPNENQLRQMLGVSRGTLREALCLLEDDGLITKRPGFGTNVRDEHLLIWNALEENFSVTEVISSMGLKPGIKNQSAAITKVDSIISRKLGIRVGLPIIVNKAIRTADGRPVVYTVNLFLLSVLTKKNRIPANHSKLLDRLRKELVELSHGSLYELLETKYDTKIDYGIAKIIPTVAKYDIAKDLNTDIGSPLLLIEQVNYDISDKAIMYNRHYWVKSMFEFTILRKRKRKGAKIKLRR